MATPDKNTKIEHIKGRYAIGVAFIAALGALITAPFLCNKKAADAATKQTIEIKTNQNSPVAGKIETQNNYFNTPAAADKGKATKTRHSNQKDTAGRVYAPNANIVTLNQSGGNNTVIIADTEAQKLRVLENTPPEASYRLYLKDNFLMVDVELKNNVPIYFKVRMLDEDNTPVYNSSHASEKELYPEEGRKYTFKVEELNTPTLSQPTFKAIITVTIESVYYDDIEKPAQKKRPFYKRSHRMYLFDKTSQTITPTNDPTDDVIYRDTTRIPWQRID